MYAIDGKHKLLPWSNFLRWECQRCGFCCEVLQIKLLKEEEKKLREKYGDVVTYIDGEPFLKRKSDGTCIFLERKDNVAVCTIYEDRPLACRIYPFYLRRWRDAKKSELFKEVSKESVVFKYRGRKFVVLVSNFCLGLGKGPPIEYGIQSALREKYFKHNEK